MKIITIANQKGGAAKTTTTGALSASLRRKGYSVLSIDMDAQGNLSDHFGAKNIRDKNVYSAIKGDIAFTDIIQRTEVGDIAPASILLAGIEKEPSGSGAEFLLRESIEKSNLRDIYDFVVIDTPPSLSLILVNALVAADYVVISMQPDLDYIKGLTHLNQSITTVRKYFNSNLKVAGILLTRYDARTNNSKKVKEIAEQCASNMGIEVFETRIRSSVAISESHASAVDLWEYNPNSTVAKDYDAFCDEFLREVNCCEQE